MCAERKRFDPPSVTPNLDYKERQRVWRNCLQAVPDVSTFMRGWFDRAPLETITLNDCKRWLAWGFWGKHLEDMEQQDMVQVHEMVADLERDHNLKFSEKGCGQNARLLAFDREPFSSSRNSIDWVVSRRHYPLLLYALTHGVVGSVSYVFLLRQAMFFCFARHLTMCGRQATTWLLRSRGFERQHAKGLSYVPLRAPRLTRFSKLEEG
eukprot:480715-Rhodomonas_salina.1